MNLKNLILATTLIIGPLTAQANFNSECKFAYREAAMDLVETADEFKAEKISAKEFGANVAFIDLGVRNFRAACYFTESNENRSCVMEYKNIYTPLKENFKALALVLGNQEKVDFSVLDSVATKFKIKLADIKCGY